MLAEHQTDDQVRENDTSVTLMQHAGAEETRCRCHHDRRQERCGVRDRHAASKHDLRAKGSPVNEPIEHGSVEHGPPVTLTTEIHGLTTDLQLLWSVGASTMTEASIITASPLGNHVRVAPLERERTGTCHIGQGRWSLGT